MSNAPTLSILHPPYIWVNFNGIYWRYPHVLLFELLRRFSFLGTRVGAFDRSYTPPTPYFVQNQISDGVIIDIISVVALLAIAI